MRILYITDAFPYPLTSGYLRHWYLIRELAARHEVTLCSLVRPDFRSEHAAAVAPYTRSVETVTIPGRSEGLPRRAVRRIGRLVLASQHERATRELREVLDRVTAEHEFDVVFCGKRSHAAAWISSGSLPVITDVCDAASRYLRGRLRHAPAVGLPEVALNLAEARRTERRVVAAGGTLVFATDRDRDAVVEGRASVRTAVVPNGVDGTYWQRKTSELGEDIVFSGVMNYPPNEDAALLLARVVLPLVRRWAPSARLWIVGRDPTPQVIQEGKREGVTVTGAVDDIRPYLERAAVYAAPMRFGAGIQNKLLEAMAMELPVVATPTALAGLSLPGHLDLGVSVAERPTDTAEAIVHRLRSRGTTNTDARRYVSDAFSWGRSGDLLESVLAEAASGGDSPPRR